MRENGPTCARAPIFAPSSSQCGPTEAPAATVESNSRENGRISQPSSSTVAPSSDTNG